MKHKITGNGPAIIILRGLGRSYDYWLDFEQELAKYFRVVMINLPAMDDFGEKSPLTIKRTARAFAEKIKSLREEIGPPPYYVFGLSLGGMTAFSLAYYYPDLVSMLILGSSSVRQYTVKRIRTIPLLKILYLHILPFMPKKPHKLIGKYLVSKRYLKQNPGIINVWDGIWQKQKIHKRNFFKQLIAALFALSPSKIKKIKIPCLVISGEEDTLVPPENSEIISNALENSTHITLPQCGHDITTEEPAYIAEMIRDFTAWKNNDDIKTIYTTLKEAPETERLRELEEKFPHKFLLEPLDFIYHKNYKTPVHAFFISHKPQKELPTVALFACFHGVEWIGSSVLINFINHFLNAMEWDEGLRELVRHINLCGIPIVNPVGRIENTRTNGNNIDLMRNSPVSSGNSSFMLGGQEISPMLPWYMGESLQPENKVTIDFLDKYVFPSDFKITMDIHSGFVNRSRIWIPYASGKKLPPKEEELFNKTKNHLDKIYRYHLYEYEKQTDVYRTHGDFWDYNLDRHAQGGRGIYLPFTLEISSLQWSLRSFLIHWKFENLFNPLKENERNSEYIKHLHLMYFLLNLARNHERFRD
ncbi:MAG: alpha/beta fold hydrolase [Oligoflexia bacterium]|nr:alpha/beta fold hydrolase [Oligoflexia bacterium]